MIHEGRETQFLKQDLRHFNVGLNLVEKYFSKQRVQIWKLGSQYWGMYGHFWVVDSEAGVVVAIVQSNSKGCYETAFQKREKYMELLFSKHGV